MGENKANIVLQIDVHHNQTDWNQYLEEFSSKNIFQSYEWGELKKKEDWDVLRILITRKLKPILLAQVLVKKVFGFKIAWCPGGPVLQTESSEVLESSLRKFREKIFAEKIFNLRCNPYIKNTDDNKKVFEQFSRPEYTLTSSKTILLEIRSGQEFLDSIRKKHRYYIKQAQKHTIDWEILSGSEASESFLQIYEKMIKDKKLNYELIDIESFSKLLGNTKDGEPRVFCLAGVKEGVPIAACIISLLSDQAFYHYAASTDQAREMSASYEMIYQLMNKLSAIGIRKLDFGGISDDDSSEGVDFFKSGFNGTVFEKVGEFDISKSGLQSYLFGKAIKFRYNK